MGKRFWILDNVGKLSVLDSLIIKNYYLSVYGEITSYTNDLLESVNQNPVIWYLNPIEIISIEPVIKVSNSNIELCFDINGLSISDSDPFFIIEKETGVGKQVANFSYRQLKFGDRISIRTLELKDAKDLIVNISYKFLI